MQIGNVTFGGLVSGLDTQAVVNAIIGAESIPLKQLQARRTLFEARRSALQEIQTALSDFRTSLEDAATLTKLAGRTTTSSDQTVAQATASATAQRGSFNASVTALAQADRVKSNQLADRFSPLVADGTLTLQSGTGTVITVNVSAATGNNNLLAVRDAVNAADAGVVASIVNTGSGESLVVRSEKTGTVNGLTLTDTTNLGLTDAGNVLQTAADAALTVDGIAVTSASNSVVDAFDGVTLDLVATGSTTINVADDTATVEASLQSLVDEFNTLADLLGKHTATSTSSTPGVLAGDSTVRRIQNSLVDIVSSSVSGLPTTAISSLSSLGVLPDGQTGRLSLDTGKLTDALASNFDDVRKVLLSASTASDLAVQVQSAATGSNGPHAIQITTAGEQARVSGSTPITGLTQNENLTITLGTLSTNVALASGDLIGDVVTKVNAALQSAGISASAADDGSGGLNLFSSAYGASAQITAVSDVADNADGKSSGIGTTLLSDTGVDVAGTINGESATGSGQLLTADAGTVADGLVVRILADAAGVASRSGDFGTVTTTDGIKKTLVDRLKLLSDPFDGTIHSASEGVDQIITSLEDRETSLQSHLDDRRAFLTIQFQRAEQALNNLQGAQITSLLGTVRA